MKSFSAILFLIFLFSVTTNALGQDTFITLTGRVLDAQTGEAVPYANIQLKSGSMGTATNADGEFIFKILQRSSVDTLLISCIGYKTILIQADGKAFMNIALNPASILLTGVTVKSESALSLLKKALTKIPQNYDTSAARLTAFYRENFYLGDFELAFNESVLEINKVFHYTKLFNDQIRLIKGRKKNISFGQDGQFLFWISNISNTARTSLGEDMIKYNQEKRTVFNPDNYRFYEYEFGETIREDDRDILIINIFPKEKSRKGFLKVKLYIDEASLAIIKIYMELTPKGVEYVNNHQKSGVAYTIMSKVVKATLDFSHLSVTVTYKNYNNRWYLNNIHRHWEALVNSKKRNMTNRLWRADMELMITDIDTTRITSFTEGNIGNSHSSMGNMIGNSYDEAFWENYNILKPVLPDSLKTSTDSSEVKLKPRVRNRLYGFTRADTLRGKISEIRSCYDVLFYHLDVTVNMDQRSIKGSNLIRFRTITPFTTIQVDLYANMKIEKILFRNQPLSYTREFDAVFIKFPREIKPGEESEIVIYYEGIPKIPDWSIPMNGGVLWDKDSLGNAWVQMVCQGSGASLWWPNKDHLSDEPDSMKIWITVPSQFTEISNGRLIRKTLVPGNQVRYEWFVSYPINNYNVTFNIGKYAHLTDQYISDDTLTIDYYVMPYNKDRALSLFEQVKPMLACYEKHFGKYPFPRDGFTLVESLYPMEHQSGVCIGKIPSENASNPNPLMWHESAHEWWGNAISCKDMADMWIHESFATYAESLVIECEHGTNAALQYINDHRSAVKNTAPVIGVYDVNHIFYDIQDMYEKGMLMLNTFRYVLNNDSTWFQLLRDIQQHFRYKTLTSDELIQFINTQTKTDYSYFFDQYLKHPGLPRLEIVLTEKGSDTLVKFRWQTDVSDFRMPVDIIIAETSEQLYPTAEWKTVTLKNTTPSEVEVDDAKFFVDVILNNKF